MKLLRLLRVMIILLHSSWMTFIGGRYSSVSSVGGVILSLAFGPDVFARILDGMAEEDKLATNKDIKANPDLLDA